MLSQANKNSSTLSTLETTPFRTGIGTEGTSTQMTTTMPTLLSTLSTTPFEQDLTSSTSPQSDTTTSNTFNSLETTPFDLLDKSPSVTPYVSAAHSSKISSTSKRTSGALTFPTMATISEKEYRTPFITPHLPSKTLTTLASLAKTLPNSPHTTALPAKAFSVSPTSLEPSETKVKTSQPLLSQTTDKSSTTFWGTTASSQRKVSPLASRLSSKPTTDIATSITLPARSSLLTSPNTIVQTSMQSPSSEKSTTHRDTVSISVRQKPPTQQVTFSKSAPVRLTSPASTTMSVTSSPLIFQSATIPQRVPNTEPMPSVSHSAASSERKTLPTSSLPSHQPSTMVLSTIGKF
ncbi:mucin-5AC-like [Branchiostoma floridae]|uniref:Mucin-5AC-like n=1 Tax=Branchiostoma floridae TaxID=7739 RepID=A0A9J7HQY9_BRAFL|nr:mucin-5AC-like [Branchiostoma floridae]